MQLLNLLNVSIHFSMRTYQNHAKPATGVEQIESRDCVPGFCDEEGISICAF
jgi:hypothetical protein